MKKGWSSHLCFFSDKVVVVGPHSVLNRHRLSQPIHDQRSHTNPLHSNSCPPCRLGLPHSGPSGISDSSLLPPVCGCTHLWLAGKATAQNGDHACKHWGEGRKLLSGILLMMTFPGGPRTYLHHSLTIVYEGTLFSKMTQFLNCWPLVTRLLLFIGQEDAALLHSHKGE